jgi:hypothetical protein
VSEEEAQEMITTRGRRAAVLCIAGVAIAGSVSTVRAAPWGPALVAFEKGPPGGCNDPPGSQGVAGTSTKVCQGSGTVEVGDEKDQISEVRDANITGPVQLNGVITSQGPVGKVVSI